MAAAVMAQSAAEAVEMRLAEARPVVAARPMAQAAARPGTREKILTPSAAPLPAAQKAAGPAEDAGAGRARRRDSGPARLVGRRWMAAAVAQTAEERPMQRGATALAAAGWADSGPRLVEPDLPQDRLVAALAPAPLRAPFSGSGQMCLQTRMLQSPARHTRQPGMPASARLGPRQPSAPSWPPPSARFRDGLAIFAPHSAPVFQKGSCPIRDEDARCEARAVASSIFYSKGRPKHVAADGG
eukprot:scaffold5009_cov103-Isochrysis_galbana.AAC.9